MLSQFCFGGPKIELSVHQFAKLTEQINLNKKLKIKKRQVLQKFKVYYIFVAFCSERLLPRYFNSLISATSTGGLKTLER
jgi:hypothetical protein